MPLSTKQPLAMTPEDYCHNLAALLSSDFRLQSTRFTARATSSLMRDPGFCLETAQAMAECRDPGVARTKLDWWRVELTKSVRRRIAAPGHACPTAALASFNLPEEYFREILDGVAMDLDYDALSHVQRTHALPPSTW